MASSGFGGGSEWRGLAAAIERTATPRGRQASGNLSIEGTRLHERALRAGVRVERALCSSGFLADRSERVHGLIVNLRQSGCELVEAPDAEIERLTEGRSIGGILGLVPLPRPPVLERILGEGPSAPVVLLVALNVEDPGNVGALVRTALAAGATALVPVGISDPFHPRAVRVSMGSLFKIPVVPFAHVDELIRVLDRYDVEKVGAVTVGGELLPAAGFDRGPRALFVGGEAFGMTAEDAAAMDRRVTIPMATGVDSFSVNAAAAILLWEIVRQMGSPNSPL